MAKSRLNLDFKLETLQQRKDFIDAYLPTIKNPTQKELETIANYLLWGKNEKGEFLDIELPSKHATWKKKGAESLDELMENPAFNENTLRRANMPPQKTYRANLDREEIRKAADPILLKAFEHLWRQIDETDLEITLYEIQIGKRVKPPRAALLKRFTEEEIEKISHQAALLSQYNYLKMRHFLKELRDQQYTLKDSISEPLFLRQTASYHEETILDLGDEIPVLPLGIRPQSSSVIQKIFNLERLPAPQDFSEDDLEQVSAFLWEDREEKELSINLEEEKHWLKIFAEWDRLQTGLDSALSKSNLPQFIETIEMYVRLANLSDIHRDILQMKLDHNSNEEIRVFINEKYSKNYNVNYISTLYCQRIVGEIVKAVKMHREVVENLFFEENFKTCKDCGRVLLLCDENFVKKSRSSDGYSPRCKSCEKILRDKRKGK